MEIKYFEDTDALSIEHARERTEIPKFSYEQIQA